MNIEQFDKIRKKPVKKNDINSVPFEDLLGFLEDGNSLDDSVSMFHNTYNLGSKHSWLHYQLISYFGTWEAVKVGDKFCGKETVRANISSDFSKGITLYALGKRSLILANSGEVQYKSRINPLVPIILAGFKQSQGIAYNEWDRETIYKIVDWELSEAMTYEPPVISNSELLTLRDAALTARSGKSAGVMANPVTSPKLNGLGSGPLAEAPKLARYMLLQTWCAHPSNRTAYSVLHPSDWDKVPEPLISQDIFNVKIEEERKLTLPWE